MRYQSKLGFHVAAGLTARKQVAAGVQVTGQWEIICRGPDGRVKWREAWQNLVVNAGLDHLLDVALSGATQITTWYVGLINGASPTIAAGDTMASHAGWTENQNYTEATRPAWTDGGVSGQSVDNSASKATFSIDTNSQTIGGAFLVSDSTKGGTTGTLYAAGTFSSAKSADNGDTLEVQATFTSADDGV